MAKQTSKASEQASKLEVVPTTSKREKFVQLAEKRTANAIKAIRLIGHLGNRNAYDFGDLDVVKITKALTAETDALRIKMSVQPGRKPDIDFKL